MTADAILKKYEDDNEYHFHDVDRKWIIQAMEEYASGTWTLCSIEHAPLQRDILFQVALGTIHAGIRFMPTAKSNVAVYQDFKKNKIRNNVVKWKLI